MSEFLSERNEYENYHDYLMVKYKSIVPKESKSIEELIKFIEDKFEAVRNPTYCPGYDKFLSGCKRKFKNSQEQNLTILHIKKNTSTAIFYEHFEPNIVVEGCEHLRVNDCLLVGIDHKNGYIDSNVNDFVKLLILERGVSEEEITTTSRRYLKYLSVLDSIKMMDEVNNRSYFSVNSNKTKEYFST